MEQLGKHIAVVGLAIAALGLVLWAIGKTGFRGLPGDIRYESDGLRVYFPIVTSIVLSVLVTAVVWIWNWWRRE